MANGNQGTLLSTLTFSEFTDLVNRDFYSEAESLMTGNAQKLFHYADETVNTGDTRRYQAIDTERFGLLKGEGADAKKTKIGIGYYKDVKAKRIAREIDITWEMRKYNKEPQILQKLTSLNEFCPNRFELDLTHRLTFSTSTSYTDMDGDTVATTCGDGFELAYSAHTLPFSSETYRNRISGDPVFSSSALELAEDLAATNIFSDFGEKVSMKWQYLFFTDNPETRNEVKRVLNSTAEVDALNAGVVNVYAGKYIPVELAYLATSAVGAPDTTKKRWWGITSSAWQAFVGVWETPNLKSPSAGNNGEDIHNDNWTYGCRMSYQSCTPGSKGFIASCPVS